MPVEIERKFLVCSSDWRDRVVHSFQLAQAYLSTDPARTIRVRIKNTEAYLTIKGKGTDISRPEFEYKIPLAEAQELLLLCESKPIQKTRYEVQFAGKTWEIDVFEGENEGLVIAEVELESEDEHVELPPWIGAEVSQDKRYFNAYLSQHPFKSW